MANPVLAGSLASVIDLADNPPEQPLHSLTNDLQQPLVLYIARVPGSHGTYLPLPKAKDKGANQDARCVPDYHEASTEGCYRARCAELALLPASRQAGGL